MNQDAPSWDDLRRRLVPERFSEAGIAALSHLIDRAERLLGKAWPNRQFERMGWWPVEFNLLAFHAAALPQFLALVLRFGTAVEEPTFAAVLRGLKRGATSTDWRHALLQLEVSRALWDSDTAITFELEINGSRKKPTW